MGRLFGTDGARGVANTELTCEMAINIGRAAAVVLTKHTNHKPKIVIGKDTRISSDMLESALVAGICSVGADVEILGVVPTPAVAFLVSKYNADAGVMISASHNPVEYNGIKLFSSTGYKLSDDIEEEIEALILDTPEQIPLKSGTEIGCVKRSKTAVNDYVKHIMSSIDGNLEGIKVAIDCANGSASATAEMLFKGLGALPFIINAEPDGTNINDKCGSTHMEAITEVMKKNKCQIGVSFDGDADRCLAVDENGNLIDGDKMIAIFANHLKKQGKLRKDTAVVTVMSNLGFFHFAEKNGINAISTKVGDRYVLEEMIKNDYMIGGEQSGHIIFKDYASTGDGQLSAVQLMSIMKSEGKKISAISDVMERFPQVMVNVTIDNEGKQKLDSDEHVNAVIKECSDSLCKDGRILVRASGTEPLIRVMVEGKDFEVINRYAIKIGEVIKERLA
ncbi:MAG: glmM [Oscillospiraceae bacterium]|nr:glmM [Oscillospiraceae bacterium]